MGTCITYDFVNEFGEYLGGSISPGFSMRYNSLNTFTSKLPQLEFNKPDNISGNSTDNSIHSGIYYGILAEVKNQVSHYKEKLENLTVILTGGDANKLPKTLKNTIFAHSQFYS